jgi:predicted metalloprotease
MGTSSKMRQMQQGKSKADNKLSVALELQTDFMLGLDTLQPKYECYP